MSEVTHSLLGDISDIVYDCCELSTSTRNSIPRMCSMMPKLTLRGSIDISI